MFEWKKELVEDGENKWEACLTFKTKEYKLIICLCNGALLLETSKKNHFLIDNTDRYSHRRFLGSVSSSKKSDNIESQALALAHRYFFQKREKTLKEIKSIEKKSETLEDIVNRLDMLTLKTDPET